ncbi:PMS1 protein homolog 1 isoform X2 [Procambarus clarkii]|uniref:PMS1 protein homolog 1 isoform X2 n=1 Tax=Procambarus clarkii TaxID=6728 RepID=UPI001E67487B|nr:PMS1 protein homolog 1-like isoform X2 [Procambarus clarkii]
MIMALHALPQDTVRLIKSTQVITTPVSIVKELVENSIDAEATIVSIKLEDCGFSRLEVRDNGIGINEEDMEFVAKPHFTSKISSFSDLASLTSYGFRGEALASLCTVAEIIITTKTKEDPMGHVYSFDQEGNVIGKRPAATPCGTTIVVSKLFKNVPVRKQFFNNPKRRREEFKKVEDLVLALSLAVPNAHLTLFHDKSSIIQKNPAPDIRTALMTVFPAVFKDFVSKVKTIQDMKLEVHLPDPRCLPNQNLSRTTADRLFIMVNQRPVNHKSFEKMVKAYYSHKMEGCHGRYPFGVVVLTVPPDALDVNLEPNKTRILLKDEDVVLESLKVMLTELYGPLDNTQTSARKKGGAPCSEVNTDITCTFSCITQPLKETNSEILRKNNRLQDGFDSSRLGEGNLLSEKDAEDPFEQCDLSNIMTTKKTQTDRKNSINNKNCSNIKVVGSSAMLRRQTAGTFDPRSQELHAVNGVKESCSSADQVVVDRMNCLASEHSNKENITNIDPKFFSSTPNNETQGICPSISESSITRVGSLRSQIEESENDLSLSCSKDTEVLNYVEPNISGISPLSISSSSNNNKTSHMCNPDTTEQSANKFSKHANGESSELSRTNHDSSLLHESLMGSDGIPVFKIAAFPSEELNTSNVGDQDCDVSRAAKENSHIGHFNNFNSENNREDDVGSEESLTPATEKTSKGCWSRGLITSNEDIQTVQLVNAPSAEAKLTKRKISLGSGLRKRASEIQDSQGTPPKKTKVNSLGPAAYDYIHGKPVKKPSSPFILYSRDIRAQVLSENPGTDFAFIAKEMADRWKALDSETKCFYTEQAKIETDKYQEEVRKIRENRGLNTTLNSPSIKTKASLDRYLAPLTPQLAKGEGKNIRRKPLESKKPWREHSKEINVTIDNIKELLKRKPSDCNSKNSTRLLGPLNACRGWLCSWDRNIVALNTFRLYETVLVNNLMKTFRLPVKELADSISFNSSTLGPESWNLLLKLQRELVPDCNSFKIELYPGASSSTVISHGEIIGMTDVVGFYGIYDFKELLASLVKCPSATIDQTRPLKLQQWIKGEAVRIIRSGPNLARREDVLERLEKLHVIKDSFDDSNRWSWQQQKCIHEKPIFTPLYSLDDLPQSQSQHNAGSQP